MKDKKTKERKKESVDNDCYNKNLLYSEAKFKSYLSTD